MPLIKSNSQQAFRSNVKEMINAGHAKDQALAAGYRVKRSKLAAGGIPRGFRNAFMKPKMHVGPIRSAVPGRTDRHNMHVPSGSYVLPADHVSTLGQNNTEAGHNILNRMFSSPDKFAQSGMGGGMAVGADTGGARGSKAPAGEPTPVVTAGGEYIIPPHHVARVGGGDLQKGHRILDKWVLETRKKHIKTLRRLPPPAKD